MSLFSEIAQNQHVETRWSPCRPGVGGGKTSFLPCFISSTCQISVIFRSVSGGKQEGVSVSVYNTFFIFHVKTNNLALLEFVVYRKKICMHIGLFY